MKEIWKDIENYEGLYQVSNLGRVRSLDRILRNSHKSFRLSKGRLVAITDNGNGYKIASLSKGGRKNFYVHRLVAQAFLPNPNNLFQVNHKDCIKSNNNVDNLEWCSPIYNTRHAIENGRVLDKITKSTNQVVNLSSGVRYNTISSCARENNINRGTLKDAFLNNPVYKNTYLKLAKGYQY